MGMIVWFGLVDLVYGYACMVWLIWSMGMIVWFGLVDLVYGYDCMVWLIQSKNSETLV